MSTITFNKGNVYYNDNAKWYRRECRTLVCIRRAPGAAETRSPRPESGSALRTGRRLKMKKGEDTANAVCYTGGRRAGEGGVGFGCMMHRARGATRNTSMVACALRRAPARQTQEQDRTTRKRENRLYAMQRDERRGDEMREEDRESR